MADDKKKTVKIDNSAIVDSPSWGSINHTAQKNEIQDQAAARKEMFAQSGDESKDDKLPHHYISDGVMKVHRGGLEAAAKAVMGSRGGVDLKSRKKAVAHLLRHMRKFGIKPNPKLEKDANDSLADLKSLVNDADGLTSKQQKHLFKLVNLTIEIRDAFKNGLEEEEKKKNDKYNKVKKAEGKGEEDGLEEEEKKKNKKYVEVKKAKSDKELSDEEKSSSKPKEKDKGKDEEDEDNDVGQEEKRAARKADKKAEKKARKEEKNKKKNNSIVNDGYEPFMNRDHAVDVLKHCGVHAYDPHGDIFDMHSDGFDSLPCPNKDVMECSITFITEMYAAFGTEPGSNLNFSPTDEEKKVIYPKFSNEPVSEDSVSVYYGIMSGSQTNRKGQNLGTKALTYLQDKAPGIPTMDDHNQMRSQGVFAKVFDAKKFRSSDGSQRVAGKIYMSNRPEYALIHDGFRKGYNNQLSIGFKVHRKDAICNECNKPMFSLKDKAGLASYDNMAWCGHMPNMELAEGKYVSMTIADMADLYELSRVTVPAYRGAAVRAWGGGGPAMNPPGGGMNDHSLFDAVNRLKDSWNSL